MKWDSIAYVVRVAYGTMLRPHMAVRLGLMKAMEVGTKKWPTKCFLGQRNSTSPALTTGKLLLYTVDAVGNFSNTTRKLCQANASHG